MTRGGRNKPPNQSLADTGATRTIIREDIAKQNGLHFTHFHNNEMVNASGDKM